MSGAIYLRFADQEKRDRFYFFLNSETRPDFVEDVSQSESPLVDMFSLMPDAGDVSMPTERELVALFEDLDFEAKETLPAILRHLQPERIAWYEFSVEQPAYFSFNKNGFNFVYSSEPLENSDEDMLYNQNLPSEFCESLKQAESKNMLEGILYFGRNYRAE